MIKKRLTLAVAASAASAALLLSACGTTGEPTAPPTTGGSAAGGATCDATVAYVGPLTGDYANLGLNIVNGAKLALDEFAKANPNCKVTLSENDSQGAPDKATPIASQLVNDSKVIGVLGPTFSGETNATGETFNEAGLVTVSPSATNVTLSTNGWKTFHRILGNDAIQGQGVALLILNTLKPQKVFTIDDGSDYGKGLTGIVNEQVGAAVVDSDQVQLKQTDFGPTVTKVKASGADLLFFGGYYPEAGLLIKQLRAGGWKGTFVSGDGTRDPGFISAAGAEAANDAILTCPCAPAPADFATKYKALSNQDPGTYSTEGYDGMNIFLQGLLAGKSSRADMLAWVNAYNATGVTGQIEFDDKGERVGGKVFAYKVVDGKISADATEIQ